MFAAAVLGKTCHAPIAQEGSRTREETEFWEGLSSKNLVVFCRFPAMDMFVTSILLGGTLTSRGRRARGTAPGGASALPIALKERKSLSRLSAYPEGPGNQ